MRSWSNDVDRDVELGVEEVRLEEAHVDELPEPGDLRVERQRLAVAEEVGLLHLRGGDEVLDAGEARAHLEGAGRLLADLDVDVDVALVLALLGGDVDVLEVAERGDAALGAVELGLAEELALLDLQLAADDLVAGLGVALDLDAAEVDQPVPLDGHDDVDLLLVGVELGLRGGLDVGVAGVAVEGLHRAQVLHQLGAVEVVAALGADHLAQVAAAAEGLDLLAVLVLLEDAELADLVAGPLGDGDGDLDAAAVRREHHPRGRHLHGEEAAIVVEGVDHQHVPLEGVLAERAARAEVEEVGGAGDHHVAQLAVGDVIVADEGDAADGDRVVLLDGELDVHLVLLEGEHLVGDLREEVALLGVLVAQLLDAAADGGVAEDGAGLELGAERLGEVVLVDLVVADEIDRLDVGPLAHEDAQVDAVVLAREVDLDVLEVSGVPHLPDVLGEALRGERPARAHLLQIAGDVLRGDAAVAGQDHLGDGHAARELGLGGGEVDVGRGGLRGDGGQGAGRGRGCGRRLVGLAGGGRPPRPGGLGAGCPHAPRETTSTAAITAAITARSRKRSAERGRAVQWRPDAVKAQPVAQRARQSQGRSVFSAPSRLA